VPDGTAALKMNMSCAYPSEALVSKKRRGVLTTPPKLWINCLCPLKAFDGYGHRPQTRPHWCMHPLYLEHMRVRERGQCSWAIICVMMSRGEHP
jgi:hypothetical protein